MTSWKDELPPDLPHEHMMEEAVRQGGDRRRRRQRRVAGLGGAAGALTVLLGLVVAPFASDERPKGDDVHVIGSASAGAPQEPTPPLELPPPSAGPTTTAAALGPATTPTSQGPAPPQGGAPPPSSVAPTTAPAAPQTPPTTPGTTSTTTPPLGQPGAPEYTGATANAATRRIMIRFSRPVVPGTGDQAATRLVIHQAGDSTCSTPTGTANEYLAGIGTDTITTDATNLVVGTTYVSIASGFVKNAHDGTENVPTGCIGVQVKG